MKYDQLRIANVNVAPIQIDTRRGIKTEVYVLVVSCG